MCKITYIHPMQSTAPTKAQLRTHCLATRKALTAEIRAQHEQDFTQHLLNYFQQQMPTVIGGYAVYNAEMDVFPLLLALQQQGCLISLPVIDADNKTMLFRQVDATSLEKRMGSPEMRLNRYGILEPTENQQEVTPDTLLVPLVGFDANRNRLGYGQGYYDRYLSEHSAHTIGAAFSCQQVDAIPAEPHDRPLDAIFTEYGKL